jgi:stage II sporulation protein M
MAFTGPGYQLAGCGLEAGSNPLGTTCGYFLHNSSIALVSWIGGFAVVGPFFILWENGSNIGGYIAEAITSPDSQVFVTNSALGNLAFLLPHGIFEIPAIILALALGIYNAQLIIYNRNKNVQYSMTEAVKEGGKWFGVVLGLLVVAAFVETWISPGFAQGVAQL